MIIRKEGRRIKNDRYAKRSFWYVYPETFFELIYLLFREKKDKHITKHYFEKNCWIIEYTHSHQQVTN